MMAARYRLDGLINLGNRLKDARQMVHGLLEEIPATSPLGRDAVQTLRMLDRLRDHLNEELSKVVPVDRDPRHVRDLVLYGRERLRWHEYDHKDLTKDAFAPWVVERW